LAGIIELGVQPIHKQAFYGFFKQLVTGEDKDFVYLEPRLQTAVKFGTGLGMGHYVHRSSWISS
jgi:hypothetical protein